ncbi:MAG: SDR family oxidoreductase, partial [Pseudomonadota bacterium]
MEHSETWHQDKVAVVTGGASGIGLAIARELSARGARVVVGARRLGDGAVGGGVASSISESALALPLDVSDSGSVDAFFGQIGWAERAPDILINNAGISIHQLVSQHEDADWDAVIGTNLSGPYRMIRRALPGMLERGWGRIINIASTAATTAVADSAAYCASKAGLLGLSRAVALEGAGHGVTCLTVSPTWVETEMMRASAADLARKSGRTTEEEIAEIANSNPQNRLVQPEEIARLVSFLCSDAAPALTMEDIQVNAG